MPRRQPEGRRLPHTHQVIDVPVVRPDVTDYVLHARCCSDPACGHVTQAHLPVGVPSGSFGPGVAAMVGLATGKYRLSKRLVQQLLSDMFGIELCRGSIANLEQQMSAALAAPVFVLVARLRPRTKRATDGHFASMLPS